jgi:antitoxin YqcF
MIWFSNTAVPDYILCGEIMMESHHSPDNLKILESLTDVIGEVKTTRPLHEHDGRRMEIVIAEDSPRTGINSYSTIGLSVIPIGYLSGSVYLGAEIVSAAAAGFVNYMDVLAACVDDILHSKFRLFPGAVYKNAFKDTYPDVCVKHLIFDTPQGWNKDLLTLDLGTRQVAWIMAVPVTDAELRLYSGSESGELQEQFEARKIDLFDLTRPSVV